LLERPRFALARRRKDFGRKRQRIGARGGHIPVSCGVCGPFPPARKALGVTVRCVNRARLFSSRQSRRGFFIAATGAASYFAAEPNEESPRCRSPPSRKR